MVHQQDILREYQYITKYKNLSKEDAIRKIANKFHIRKDDVDIIITYLLGEGIGRNRNMLKDRTEEIGYINEWEEGKK